VKTIKVKNTKRRTKQMSKDENDMEELTRFDPCIESEPYARYDRASMEMHKHGEWLKYSDVKELWNTRPKEEKGVAEALEMVDEIIAANNKSIDSLWGDNSQIGTMLFKVVSSYNVRFAKIRSTLKGG
jgi:hypothetical protein